ncbi:hypothetical protein Ancab_015955 [Ancistrocladus abbreviatus]
MPYVQGKSPTIEKTSMLQTLKDHTYHSLSKFSEEMVICIASVYCWLFSNDSADSMNNQLSVLSKTPVNIVLLQHGSQDGHAH